jgi:C-terminal processing protease CtpA/Prc
MKKISILFLGIYAVLISCNKDDDITINGPDGASVSVQDFMWKAMNIWYFWQSDVVDLADDRFPTNEEYFEFLASEQDPADFFNNKLRFSEDRFSFYNEDYKTITDNLISGITRSNGLEFGLFYYGDNTTDLYGYVRYIVPNSDASTKDISRGELFFAVDGQSLNENNFRDLLFGKNATYTLNMADIADGVITPNDKSVELTKQDGLLENPLFIAKSFDINNQKIGYLMYNGFTQKFDEDLNDAFGQFVADGVTDLILDFRYNPGGSSNSSRLLASMVFSTNTNNLYIRQRWNEKLQDVFSEEQLADYFADRTPAGTAINTLNLNRVYVLTTNSSASASELVINGLDPYIEVIKIGTTTKGKNEFSITLVDDPERDGLPFVYTPSRENKINPDNSWAIQPLVGRTENSVGFSDYTAGFEPDIELREDLENLGVLGDENEPLLARAIQEITGISGKKDFTVKTPVELYTSSKMFAPLKDNMVLDKPIHLNLDLK